MDELPRLLVLIGSGEMAPRMTRVQRDVVRRLSARRDRNAAGRVRASIVDTPYGFQPNADALTAEIAEHFETRLGTSVSIASFRRSDDDVVSRETAFARIGDSELIFSGPGSPSYAVRQWSGSAIPQLFADKIATGGALVLASAAALAIGRLTLPVYEIYKAGEDAHWLPGLDVLATLGIDAVVITHYDNAEGGGHDTRFCFMGERRLAVLEEQLSDDTLILGVDEHTALVLDLDADRASVEGRGGVTLRQHGRSIVFASGQEFELAELRAGAPPPADALPTASGRLDPGNDAAGDGEVAVLVRSLLSQVAELEARSDIIRLGEIADRSLSDRPRVVQPLIDTLIDLRQRARANGDWTTADTIRARLLNLGIELRDTADGTTQAASPVEAR